jgi:type VII secretion-associated protein (TIGR03931 family)
VTRVAVDAGATRLRVAIDEPRPRVLAELPPSELCRAIADLFGGPVDELVVVHPTGARPAVPVRIARVVRAAPSAAAVAVHVDGAGCCVVVDVGHTGTEVALVRGGRILAVRRPAASGARLDAVTRTLLNPTTSVDDTEVRRVREELSLLPTARTRGAPGSVLDAVELRRALATSLTAVVDAVRAVLAIAGPGRAPPVLLVGGVARTPLLAELLDAAGVGDVRVAERPDAAAVLGALRLPPALTDLVEPTDPATSSASPTEPWLPSPRTRHPWPRVVGAAMAAGVAAAGLLAVGAALPPARSDPLPTAGDLVQYGYAVGLPAGWAHTGGLPERRRSLLTPLRAPDGSDLISVERTPLGYDADAEPRRARAELRATFTAAVSAGAPLSAFDANARFAGRPVVAYREAGGETGDVDWYVVLDGDAQLSVGCRHTPTGAPAVAAACATVVGSLHRTA